jgi:RND family efflux transporter MFP subunit
VAVLAAIWLVRTSPRAGRRRRKKKRARLVEVTSVQPAAHQVVVHAMGTVTPARRVTIHPQVQGKVVSISDELTPGTVFAKGKRLLRIEASDYRLAVRQRESELARARAELAQEKGRQAIAAKEYELLGKNVAGGNPALMLRKPQLETAKAAVRAAEAALARARLDLRRTVIRAPFNSVVAERHVNVGSRVTLGTNLVTVVGTDHYWVEVSVPVDELRWIHFPSEPSSRDESTPPTSSPARVKDVAGWGESGSRMGRVLQLRPALEEQGRMARLLVEVPDPLALEKRNKGKPKLIVDSYVNVEILGDHLRSAFALDRRLLREEQTVWVLSPAGKLDIRPVEVAFRSQDKVYVTEGLREGDRVVVTDLATPVDGMPLRTEGSLSTASPGTTKAQPPERRRAAISASPDGAPRDAERPSRVRGKRNERKKPQ